MGLENNFEATTNLSDDMCDFLNVPRETKMNRGEILLIIARYIKDNNLRDSNEIRIIHPDEKLGKLLGEPQPNLKDKNLSSDYTYYNLRHYIERHCKTNLKNKNK